MEEQKEKVEALKRFATGAAQALAAEFEAATKDWAPWSDELRELQGWQLQKRMREAVVFCADAIYAGMILDDKDFAEFVERAVRQEELERVASMARRDFLKQKAAEYEQRRG